MRELYKELSLPVNGEQRNFRLRRMDAFSGICILRYLLRLEETKKNPDILDLISSLTDGELLRVFNVCMEYVEIVMPAGNGPVMKDGVWLTPEIQHEIQTCMRIMIASISWNLSGFFGGGGSSSKPAGQTTSPQDA